MTHTYTPKTALFSFFIALFVALLAAQPAFAQKEDKVKSANKAKAVPPFEQSKPYTKATKGAWKVECYKTKLKAADGKVNKEIENCVVIQDVISSKDKRIKSRISLMQADVRDKNGKLTTREAIRVAAPLGVLIPLGLAVELDGKAVGRFQYIQCVPSVCLTQVDLKNDLKKKLMSAKNMKMLVAFPPNRNFPMNIKMSGLKDAIAIRDKAHAANK